jgi:hypothetical protein
MVNLALCFMASAIVSLAAAGQTTTATTGAVNGFVTDSSHAAAPGVIVSLSGPALIQPRTTITDAAGAYRFSAVPPGDHALTFELSGFETVVRSGVRVGLGATATVNAELNPGAVASTVTVSGSSTAIDLAATAVTTHFNSERLATLPGARDIFAILANTPGVAMAKMDVGGNGGLATQEYTVYGLRALTGMNRNEVEGIRVGGANGANDNYFSDYASFTEIAVKAAGHSAATPVPGTMAQYVSKSGGNTYHASAYADYQDESWQATNIDADQLASGVVGGAGVAARDVNRLEHFRDFTADIGGYVKKDKAWWYGSYRNSSIGQRYPWLLDTEATLNADVVTGKVTYLLTGRQRLTGYWQHETFAQSSYFAAGTNQPIQTSDALPSIVFPVDVWKGDYSAAVGDALYFEVRAGGYSSSAATTFKSTAPRIADIGANTVGGGPIEQKRLLSRPQVNGFASFMKAGWIGSHLFKIGGEYMEDRVNAPISRYGNPCDCLSVLNNGVPTQVQLLLGANESKNDLTTAAAYVEDTWRPSNRFTLSLGLRFDRYQPGLPAQEGPAGQAFAAIDPVLTFNNWAPRAGLNADLTGDGKTVVKVNYGRFWLYPAPLFTAALNPNATGWTRTYLWTNDANSNGRWDAGEEGALAAVSGGSASTRLDPDIGNTYVHQATAYLEREVVPSVAARTGVVWNARRQPFGTVNSSRPTSAYSVPVTILDPGPDGRAGSADDGGALTGYELAPQFLGVAPINLTTNLPNGDSEYLTWELTAAKRQTTGWSLLASFTHTWNREAAFGTGNDVTPNILINTTDGQDRFTTWQAKVNGTVNLPWGFLMAPVVRHQSGTPYARTFVRTLNYGNATIKAEPTAANRTANITLVDVRTEKTVRFGPARVKGFFDIYNLFNTNAPQIVTTSSGAAWLRPTAITGPRILRIGGRFEW